MPEPAAVEDLFLAALDRPPADRDAFVEAACAGDADRLRRVRELLAAHHRSRGPLDAPPVEGPTTALPPTAEGSGATIGRYRLIEPIGEGGMGEVWLAQQQEPVKRLVALKVIRAGLDSKQVLARFEAERQALALMDHPHIAKVLDAGATPEGRPYFVMELVKGTPITKYCDEHRLTPKQRLELFVQVCQAVQHAHQKGVIHRDIKPSNVLVAPYDGVPVVKVIDFGVAKAAGVSLTEKTLVTGLGAVVGTPEYMSPEQAELNNADIDTRSDVYALGVLLYELLTGTTPLTRGRVKEAALLEVLRVIREEEPPRPSDRLSTTAELPSIAAVRGVEPARLSKLVRGDLDWIVMKALEKDRGRRYETANGFGLDVQRYLADEPVTAGPPGTGYRLRKFVRRNRGPVVAVSVVVLLLAAGVVGTTTGLIRALASEKKLVHERDDKEEARRQARRALNTVTDQVFDDLLGRQVQLTDQHREFLRKLLAFHADFAASGADDFQGRRDRAAALFRVGSIRFELGEYTAAEAAERDAIAIQKELAAEAPGDAEVRKELATTHGYLASALTATDRPIEAEAVRRDGLALWGQLAKDFSDRPEFREEWVREHWSLGLILRNSDRKKEAEEIYRASLAIGQQLARDFPGRPEFQLDVAEAYYTLAEVLDAVHRTKEAEDAYDKALALRTRLAEAHPKDARFHKNLTLNQVMLGVMYRATHRPKEAEEAYQKAIAQGKREVAQFPSRPEFKFTLGMCYQNLGVLMGETRGPKEAEETCREALVIFKQLAADYPNRGDFRAMLAMAQARVANGLVGLKRFVEAEAAYREAIALYRERVEENPRNTEDPQLLAQLHQRRAQLLGALNRPQDAAAEFLEAVAVNERLAAAHGDRPVFRYDRAVFHESLGEFFQSRGKPKEAEAAFGKALILLKVLVAEVPNEAPYRHALAVTHYNMGNLLVSDRPADAIAEFRAAIEAEDDYPEARTNLGRALTESGDPAAGILELRKALGTKKEFPEAYIAHTNLGNAMMALDRRPEAIAAYQDALRVNPKYAEAHYGLGNAHFPAKPAEAIDAYRKAINFDPNDARFHNNLGNALAVSGDPDGASVEFRKSIALDKDLPNPHQGMARVLQVAGQFREAIAEFREAARLEKDNARAQADLRAAEELARLEERLSAAIAHKDKPKNAAEAVGFARLCQLKHREQYVAAVRFFGEAFDRDPKLAENLETWDRYNAACTAALAAAGKGKDADKLDDKERVRLRKLSIDWLRADLAAWGRVLDKEPQKASMAVEFLQHWLDDTDFAAVRGKEGLAKLSETERKAWQKLWDDTAALLKRAAEIAGKNKAEPK